MKTVRIFISSPGDVREEREKARKIIARLEERYAGQAVLRSVLWEDLPLQADVSFQQGIDVVLSDEQGIDIAVFILWSRLGTPTGALIQKPDGGQYLSGTEREFDLMLRARARCLAEGIQPVRPALLAYTRDDPESFQTHLHRYTETDRLREAVEQRALVEDFIREEFHDAEGRNLRAYHTYRHPVEFGGRLRAHLIGLLDEILELENPGPEWEGAPYVGLAAFDFSQERIFRGREREVCDIADRLRRTAEAGCAFTLVLGASGCGKSSLVRAGLLPMLCVHDLEAEAVRWRWTVCSPGRDGDDLIPGLVRAMMKETALPELSAAEGDEAGLAADLVRDADLTVRHVFLRAFGMADGTAVGQVRLVLALDQLEEIFAPTVLPEKRERFLAVVERLARSGRVWVVATARSDFYATLQESPALRRLRGEHGLHDLTPMGPESLRRAITHPARLAGLRFEAATETTPGLEEKIFTDALGHPEALPHLQYLLLELYERRRDSTLTTFAYEELGGVEGVLARRAEEAFASNGDAAAFDTVMRALVSIQPGNRRALRRTAPLQTLQGSPAGSQLIEALTTARLLTTNRDAAGQPTVTVVHEALLRSWPRLAAWIEQNQTFLKVRARLEAEAREWADAGMGERYLLPEGLRLAEAVDLWQRFPADLGPAETDFVCRSMAAAEAKRRAELKRLRRRNAVLTILTVLALAGGALAWLAQRNATRAGVEREHAEAERQRAMAASAKATANAERANAERERANSEREYADVARKTAEDRRKVALGDAAALQYGAFQLLVVEAGYDPAPTEHKDDVKIGGELVRFLSPVEKGTDYFYFVKGSDEVEETQIALLDETDKEVEYRAAVHIHNFAMATFRPNYSGTVQIYVKATTSQPGQTIVVRIGRRKSRDD